MFFKYNSINLASYALTAATVFGGVAHARNLEIKTFAAGAAGFHVTSHLIMGDSEAMLVDAQFTRSEATKLADMITATGRDLKTVYITHGHPDHYFGAEVLKKRFPHARFVTNSESLSDIKATGEEKLKAWKGMYKDDLTDAVPQIDLSNEKSFLINGIEVRILNLNSGESEHAVAVEVPSLKTVIAGDALFDRVHLWLAEGRLDGFVANLKSLKKLGARTYLAGHSIDGKGKGKELINANERYVSEFRKALKKGKTAEEIANQVKDRYKTYQLPIIADIAAKALFTTQK